MRKFTFRKFNIKKINTSNLKQLIILLSVLEGITDLIKIKI